MTRREDIVFWTTLGVMLVVALFVPVPWIKLGVMVLAMVICDSVLPPAVDR
jgi:hypothetical protein